MSDRPVEFKWSDTVRPQFEAPVLSVQVNFKLDIWYYIDIRYMTLRQLSACILNIDIWHSYLRLIPGADTLHWYVVLILALVSGKDIFTDI